MKCYYEVLQVDREANDGEIKTAYRKLALKWHPDKNLENTELAKEQFQLVQQAYDVLSDRQERAWYDKHRESILHGADSEYKDEFLDVFPYFTTSCFKGFGDDENGFYSVYGNVFDKLIEEEMKFVSSTKDGFHNIPKFGNSTSDYEEIVRPFYNYWSSYSTKKPFSWLDPHDIRNIGNRKVVKMVEKENEKVRQKAKKERNEEIRNLVAFVRKRDKRVQTYLKLMEAKKLENREKQELMMKEKKLQRIQQINNSGNQAEWMKFDNVKSELEELEKSLANEFGDVSCESEDEDRVEENISNLYCVACNKMFKNVNAFKNHESSKKHKENVARIKESMREDDNLEIGMSNNEDSSIGELSESEEETAVKKSKEANNSKEFKTASTDLYCVACDKEFKNISTFKNHESSKKHQVNYLKLANSTKRDDVELGNCTNIDESPLNSLSEIEDEIILEKPKKKNKSKKTKNVIKPELSDVEIEISHSLSESEEAIIEKPKKKNKSRKSKNVIKLESSDDEIVSSQKEVKNGITESIHQLNGDELHDDKVVEQTKPRKEKQKKKKTKEVNVSGVSTKKELNLDLCCGKCSSEFPSKNKLFEHLKKTGHSMYLPSAGSKNKGKKGKVKEDLF